MAKKFYIPIESANQYLSKQVKKWYIPVLSGGSSVSKKVKKAYCAVQVGGQWVSKCFYEDGGSVPQTFALHWETLVKKIIDGKAYTVVPNQKDVAINKDSLGFTYFFIVPNDGSDYWVLTLSTDSDGVPYHIVSQGQNDSCYVSSPIVYSAVDFRDTWYVGYFTPFEYNYDPQYPADYSPNCYYNNQSVLWEDYDVITTQYLLPLIYSNRFAQDYQTGSTVYTWDEADIETTVRWAMGIFLFKNASKKSDTKYTNFLQNKDSIISYIMNNLGNAKRIVIKLSYYLQMGCLYVEVYTNSTGYAQGRASERRTAGGFEYVTPSNDFNADKKIVIEVYDSTISKSTFSGAQTPQWKVGMFIGSNFGWVSALTSNLGITFDYIT